ncbi:DUF6266 family protein [Pedobacter metabolipauper]|uniref:Uncharacterized protein n=1 Tax=Pedobacter metabolipauper TaxID=425513 RepID=A0A4R6SX83_9SPHI|nr:DUF6266 family protein [Pedobacter metabolipauper]TDQ10036.1 hypothetical protein ATK78_2195 [Pedobacter metabolipauper]
MGIIRGGILGGFRNKTGSVIGSSWRTLDVIKGLPKLSGKAPTQSQLEQQAKFGLVTGFLSWISNLVAVGYRSLSGVETEMNVAVAYHLKNAVTGVYPNYELNYGKLMYSRGKLDWPLEYSVATAPNASLAFTWKHEGEDYEFMSATDLVTVLVYNPEKDRFVRLVNAATRSEQELNLQLPVAFAGDTVHCYLSFKSTVRKDLVSSTIYMGQMVVLN